MRCSDQVMHDPLFIIQHVCVLSDQLQHAVLHKKLIHFSRKTASAVV